MTFYHPKSGRIAVSAALATLICGPAFALDSDAVASRMQSLLSYQGTDMAFDTVETDGDDIILKGVSIGIQDIAERAKLGDITLGDVEETNGGYFIGEVSVPDYTLAQKEFTMTASGMRISGMRIPAEDSTDLMANIALYDSLEIEQFSMVAGDNEILTMRNLNAEMDIPDDISGKISYSGGIERIFIDFNAIENPNGDEARQTMKELGYESLEARMEMRGNWNLSDGRLVLEANRFEVEDAIALDFTVDLSGYTPEFLAAVQEMSKQMADATPEQQSAQGLAMMGLMQQLVFHSASIRIDDASLTNRLLDYYAAKQGVDREALINQTKGVLPFMLAQLGNPDFATKVTEAVSAYLDDPQNIELRAQPASPMPFAMLMATGMTAPQTLPDQLGVTVTANQ